MGTLRLAGLAAAAALVVGVLIGLVAAPGGTDATSPPRAENVKLQRLAAPDVGAIDVPALVLPKDMPTVVTPPPPPPRTTPPPPPPPVVTPPPPPPPGITIDPGGGVN